MSEGPDNEKNIQNLYFFNSKGELQTNGVELKINTFRINLMPEGPDNVKNIQNLYFF